MTERQKAGWELLRRMIEKQHQQKDEEKWIQEFGNNSTSTPFCLDCEDTEHLFPNSGLIETANLKEGFGVFLIGCGVVAAVANLFILTAVIPHIRYRNALFMIITNFALIDEFKALCAIYMGSVLVSLNLNSIASEGQYEYLLFFKMLQSSIFMMYFGNLCSVFNLILATINEFLYIRMPLKYRFFVTGCRVAIAIFSTWILALIFSLAKSLHSAGVGGASGGSILVIDTKSPSNQTVENNLMSREKQIVHQDKQNTIPDYVSSHEKMDTTHSLISETDLLGSNMTRFNKSVKAPYLRSVEGSQNSDIYTLILISCLLICLIVVGGVYISLYLTIRRANALRATMTKPNRGNNKKYIPMLAVDEVKGMKDKRDSNKLSRNGSKMEPTKKNGTATNPRSVSVENELCVGTKQNEDGMQLTEVEDEKLGVKAHSRKVSSDSSFCWSESKLSDSRPTNQANSPMIKKETSLRRLRAKLLFEKKRPKEDRNSGEHHVEFECPVSTSVCDSTAEVGTPTSRKSIRFRFHNKGLKRGTSSDRLFKRLKCVLVIMTVCFVNLIYLSVYFCIQLLHMIYIRGGISRDRLLQGYMTSFVLRSLFVLHASLNPLILFRIQSFRTAFFQLCPRLKPIFCPKKPPVTAQQHIISAEASRTTANKTGGTGTQVTQPPPKETQL